MADLLALSRDLERLEAAGGGAFEAVVERVVHEVAEGMGVFADEVAIFLPAEGDTFRFAAPLPLFRDGSSFPARSSLTHKVFVEGRPLLNNNVKAGKPLSIYERAKISDRNPRPIQKMLAVPMRDGTGAVGVLQVSRRGLAVRESGPDFTEPDVALLTGLATTMAPSFRRLAPAAVGQPEGK